MAQLSKSIYTECSEIFTQIRMEIIAHNKNSKQIYIFIKLLDNKLKYTIDNIVLNSALNSYTKHDTETDYEIHRTKQDIVTYKCYNYTKAHVQTKQLLLYQTP